eukprot:7781992-Pyramimonas_sp.AAC.2
MPYTQRLRGLGGFLGSALDPPPWRAERSKGGARGAAKGSSADPRNPRGPRSCHVHVVRALHLCAPLLSRASPGAWARQLA